MSLEIGTSFFDRAQLNRLYLKTETETSVLKNKQEDVFR
jgi:hypothetical protein